MNVLIINASILLVLQALNLAADYKLNPSSLLRGKYAKYAWAWQFICFPLNYWLYTTWPWIMYIGALGIMYQSLQYGVILGMKIERGDV